MGAGTLPSSRCPTFIRDMFDESLDFMRRKSWPDCLDDEFGENNISSTNGRGAGNSAPAALAAEEVLVLPMLIKVRFLSPPYSNC